MVEFWLLGAGCNSAINKGWGNPLDFPIPRFLHLWKWDIWAKRLSRSGNKPPSGLELSNSAAIGEKPHTNDHLMVATVAQSWTRKVYTMPGSLMRRPQGRGFCSSPSIFALSYKPTNSGKSNTHKCCPTMAVGHDIVLINIRWKTQQRDQGKDDAMLTYIRKRLFAL